MGSHRTEGRARRGPLVARPWGVGRAEPILLREHRRAAPRVLTVLKELTKGCVRGGSAPPNGSRLSCGRLACRRKAVGRQSVPARAQHSASLRAISAASFKRLLGSVLPASAALDLNANPGPDCGDYENNLEGSRSPTLDEA